MLTNYKDNQYEYFIQKIRILINFSAKQAAIDNTEANLNRDCLPHIYNTVT